MEIRLRAERKAGELLQTMEKAKPSSVAKPGVKGFQRRSDGGTDVKTLAALGISKQQSSEWQKLASVPKAEFEAALVTLEMPSARGITESQKDELVSEDATMAKGRELARPVMDFSEIMAAIESMIEDKAAFVRLWNEADKEMKLLVAERSGVSRRRLQSDARHWARQLNDPSAYRTAVFGRIYNVFMGDPRTGSCSLRQRRT